MRLKEIMNNFHAMYHQGSVVWFSYETCIGFKREYGCAIVRENQWGKTTKKHINHIKNEHEYIQLNNEDFTKELREI